MRIKHVLAGVGLSCLSLALALALLEAGCRVAERVRAYRADRRLAGVRPVRDRPAEEFLVLGIGESSMMGVPYTSPYSDRVGPLQIVKHYLVRSDTGRRMTIDRHTGLGSSLDRLVDTVAPKLARRPDLIVVAAGHNDFMAHATPDWGCETYRVPYPTLLERSAIYRFVSERLSRHHLGDQPDLSARRLFDLPLVCPAEWRRVLGDFERAAEQLADFAERERIPIVFVALASPDAAWNPNRSIYRGAEEERPDLEGRYLWGRYYLEQGLLDDARVCLEEARRIDPGFAEVQFRLGEVYRAEGRQQEAQACFETAREQDGFPLRTLNQQRAVLRALGARPGVSIVDMTRVFQEDGAAYLDETRFHDIFHPTIRGYHLMAQAIVKAVAARRVLGETFREAPAFDDDATLLSGLGFDRHDWTLVLLGALVAQSNTRYYGGDRATRDRQLLGQLDLLRLLDGHLFALSYAAREAETRKDLLAVRAALDRQPAAAGIRGACRMAPVQAGAAPPDREFYEARRRWDETRRDAAAAVRDYPWFGLALESLFRAPPVHVSGVPSRYVFYAVDPPTDGLGADGAALRWRGQHFDRGFVTEPTSKVDAEVVFALDGRYRWFESQVAVADTDDGGAIVTCGVFGDGRRLFQSHPLRRGGDAEAIRVDVAGVREMTLSCTLGGDGMTAHPAWLNPELTE